MVARPRNHLNLLDKSGRSAGVLHFGSVRIREESGPTAGKAARGSAAPKHLSAGNAGHFAFPTMTTIFAVDPVIRGGSLSRSVTP